MIYGDHFVMRNILLFFLLILLSGLTIAQNQDIQLGSGANGQQVRNQGALYDYSDPQSVNIKVGILGFVKFPGRYIVPSNTKVSDLLALAGGPAQDAKVDEFRLVRTNSDSSQSVIKLNFNDFLYDGDASKINTTLTLKAGDILLASGGQPKLFFKDYFSIISATISVLLSIYIIIRK